MRKLNPILLSIYEFIVLFFLLNSFDRFMSNINSFYFNHDVLFFDLGLLIIGFFIVVSYLKKYNLIPIILIILVYSQLLFIYNIALDKVINFKDIFLVDWGYINFIILLISVVVNILISRLKTNKYKLLKTINAIIIIVCTLLYTANMGYFADEYRNLRASGLNMNLTWNILIFSILNVNQFSKYRVFK